MLTRLHITGFKNLLDVSVSFAPFTCVAGANGVGKSNLFDAIQFLQLLTSLELIEAAQSIRDERGRSADVRGLFYHDGERFVESMCFEAEMIVPKEGADHLRQKAEATSTFLRYILELRYRGEESDYGPLEITREELSYIRKGDAHKHLKFRHDATHWRGPLIVAKRKTAKPYLRTAVDEHGRTVINIQQDGTQGRPQPRLAEPLPRTVLSSLSSAESPTAVVARNEMAGWRLLHLEPSSLRQSDNLRAPSEVAPSGAHLPATLNRLTQNGGLHEYTQGAAVRQRIANRLSELVDDVQDVRVEKDEKRELLTLVARLSSGTEHPARSLSDGTLRFLALAVIEQSTTAGGLFCLEEPENGIHPERVPAMLNLLQDIAADPTEPANSDNTLRQVIINTHSPLVVSEVPDDSLVVAEPTWIDGAKYNLHGRVQTVQFSALPDTWRTESGISAECPKGHLLDYLNPIRRRNAADTLPSRRRVVDREDLQPLLPFPSDASE